MTGKTIVITSGKGGVGKTTTTANIGAALAMRDHRVVVIDTDIGLRNLDVIMGLENRIVYDLVNVIEGKCRIRQAMIQDKQGLELYLIPAAQTRDKDSIEPAQLRELCTGLEQEYDYILIDCPAGIERGFKNATAAAQEAIIVTTPEVASDTRRRPGCRPAGGVGFTSAAPYHQPHLRRHGAARRHDESKRRGVVVGNRRSSAWCQPMNAPYPPPTAACRWCTMGGPPPGAAFLRIAARIDGEEVPIQEISPRPGVFNKLRDMVGMKGRAYSHA